MRKQKGTRYQQAVRATKPCYYSGDDPAWAPYRAPSPLIGLIGIIGYLIVAALVALALWGALVLLFSMGRP